MERMPENCLKSMLIQCSETADCQFMDLGSAAMCSMGYEALLRKASAEVFTPSWSGGGASERRHLGTEAAGRYCPLPAPLSSRFRAPFEIDDLQATFRLP
jgi:hypothetical protein